MAFDTIPQVYEGEMKHASLWQLKAGFLTSKKTSRATKSSKECANKAKRLETVTLPTTQQVQDISFSPEGGISIQRATETHQGDSLSGRHIHENDSARGRFWSAYEKS
jgi:hypothetical protein